MAIELTLRCAVAIEDDWYFGQTDIHSRDFLSVQCHVLHRRSQDFQRVGARQGWIQDFWLGDDGGAEGPERGASGVASSVRAHV